MNDSEYEDRGLLWIKQTDGLVLFQGSVWSPANFKEELLAPRETLINAGKISVKERKVKKTPVGKKCPLKTVALEVTLWKEDLEKVENESIVNQSALGWAESIKWV